MKNRFFIVITLLVFLVTLTGNAQATPPDTTALVYVNLGSSGDLDRFATTQLPLYATLDGGLLTGANQAGEQALREAGLSFQVIDPDLRSGYYYLANTHPSRQEPDYGLYGQVLLDIVNGVLLRMDPSEAGALTQAGTELRLITLTPKPIPSAQAEGIFPDVIVPDPLIQGMMDQVAQDDVSQYDRELAGEVPVWVDGAWYTIPSRYTYSGTPIQKTTSYVGQHMAELGLDVEYHNWGGGSYPNVIGEMPGLVNPEDIFIIGGHIDDVQGTPGADDNASGSVAALIAADILSQYQWGCTLRFAFWTGEEQGLVGSGYYAQRSYQQGENIEGYLNLDMIAWNTIGSPNTIYLGYGSSVPPSHDLALLFEDVVDAYDIDLLPVIGTAYSGSSDHGSFLQYGYPAILGIEGDDDFNPYYHGPGDTPAHTDLTYFTTYIKASIATYAHMSGCLIPSGVGSLDGHVTNASGGSPIQGATVSADDGLGHSFSATTDASGYYTRTLLAGTYDVTASAYGYLTGFESGVEVVTDTLTTQDFALTPAPIYTVSGYVTDSVTHGPLYAQVEFLDAPVDPVWTNPATGHYSLSVAEGTWNMRASADLHQSEEVEVVVSGNLTHDFTLDPLPCILLVDDDQDNPDVRAAYTAALDGLGYDYDIWDVSDLGSPSADDIAGYMQLMWFNGYPYSGTFTGDNEAAVSSYLDAGGNFFLSSQDYLYEMDLTSFGQSYLRIASFTSDVNQTSVTGQNVFSGLGPYSLSYPFTNYSDTVNPNAQGQVAFMGNVGNAAVSFDGDFNTVFFGYPFEALPQAGRTAVMERMADDFFGGCEPPPPPEDIYIYPAAQEGFGEIGMQVSYVYSVTNATLIDQDIDLFLTGNAWLTEAPTSTGVLPAGASTDITVTVSIPMMPASVIIATDTFTLTAEGEVGEATATGTTNANVNPGVEVVSPPEGSGRPSEIISYEFTLTNMGNYTDSFTLEASGLWSATLPGGANTGPLAAGDSMSITVLVEIPPEAPAGYMEVTILTAVSDLDPSVFVDAGVTTTTTVMFNSFLPVLRK